MVDTGASKSLGSLFDNNLLYLLMLMAPYEYIQRVPHIRAHQKQQAPTRRVSPSLTTAIWFVATGSADRGAWASPFTELFQQQREGGGQ